MRHYPIGVLVCTLAAAGFFAATRTPNANASHISYADLPGLGYQVSVRVDASQVPLCQDVWVIGGNNAPETRLGVPGGKAGCNTSLEFQAAVDALLVDYPPPVPTVTVTRTFVQPPDTVVMPAQTVTAAAVTVTQPARTVTAPAATVTLPAVTQTATETVTTTATLTVPDPSAATKVAALKRQMGRLRAQAHRLAIRLRTQAHPRH